MNVYAPSLHPARRGGFTVVEIMVALTIGMMVLASLAMLLSETFRLWYAAQGRWQLALQGRLARERILRGAFGGDGLRAAGTNSLAWSNHGSWDRFQYATPGDSNHFYVIWRWNACGSHGSTNNALYTARTDNSAPWWSGYYGNTGAENRRLMNPAFKVDFDVPSLSNRVLTLPYEIRWVTGGEAFSEDKRIREYLVNE